VNPDRGPDAKQASIPASARSSAPDSSAGVPPAVAGASRPRFGEITIRNRGRLPHWEKESATYFITFRLADSLPKSVLDQIESEREAIVKTANQLNRPLSPDERAKLKTLSSPTIEKYLDTGAGACHLKNHAIAQVIANALRHFDDQRYRLFAWCIMPNHVHVVVRILPGHTLADVIHSWKSFTAKRANTILGLEGAFWQREYYDHLVRNESELHRAIRYVAENPEKAKLKNWRRVWVLGQDTRATPAKEADPIEFATP
jgi:REP element-mobilizing transposase RayT